MRSCNWLPANGVALLIALVSCAPREEAVEPDRGITAVETEPDAATVGADDAATAGATQAMARATLTGAPGSGISGMVEVTEQTGGVKVVVHTTGVQASGPIGIHVHEVGTCTPPDFESAGEHFNPGGSPHACPPNTPRHAGDFGTIEIGAGGEGHLELETDLLTVVEGTASVVGRAVVLHDGIDDCTTQPSGDSGNRIACGAFERVTR
jgi:Cu-Zn family superoxide dismutase